MSKVKKKRSPQTPNTWQIRTLYWEADAIHAVTNAKDGDILIVTTSFIAERVKNTAKRLAQKKTLTVQLKAE